LTLQLFSSLCFSKLFRVFNKKSNKMTSAKRIVAFISGANTGIGLAVANQLAKDHGCHVVIGSRNKAAGIEAAAVLAANGLAASSVQLDLSSDESIEVAVSSIENEFGVLDVLINNAGILLDRPAEGTEADKYLSTRELFNLTFSTNVIGTACLTEACLPLLRKSDFARLVFVSSRMGSLSESTNKDTPYYNTDYKSYDSSKAALNMLALNYARILDNTGALVNVVCPGLVQTKLTNYHAWGTSTDVGAQRIVQLATAVKGGPTATFSDRDGSIPW
jgi:NAD(P)-dependent dehydrogenase (short-subunit alcohol dehydrogenase family)